jgi:PAS domain S-box-containing protein
MIILDEEDCIVYCNKASSVITGYSQDEIKGKPLNKIFSTDPSGCLQIDEDLAECKRKGSTTSSNWRCRPDGSKYWSSLKLDRMIDGSGTICLLKDLTEEKWIESELRRSEETYRLMVARVKDYAIFLIDPTGHIMTWNEGAKQTKGYSQEEIVGKHFSIFYTQEDLDDGKPARELVIATQTGKYEEEGWRVKKDGSVFWANIVLTAVYNQEKKLIGFAKVTRDLSERKASERELKESRDQYRKLTAELRKINEELSYTNRELEQFTSIVSHDLQEPVRTVKSFLQLIQEKLERKEYNNLLIYVNKAIEASNRMRELIQNLLSYSQLTKEEITEKPVDVKELISRSLQNLKASIDLANAQIIINTEIETIQGDPVQLIQLIQNLVSNALKFTNQSSPKILINCLKENDHVKFSVTDNGIGIDRSDSEKIFEIFRRLHTKKEYPGTGIGLAICKKIVDRHKGRIWPESQPGEGTTFHFTLHEEMSEENN